MPCSYQINAFCNTKIHLNIFTGAEMSFVSLFFITFIPFYICMFYCIPRRFKKPYLLIGSTAFGIYILQESFWWVVLALVISYSSCILIEYDQKHAQIYKNVGIILSIALFVLLKYSGLIHIPLTFTAPVGISFYTLQILSYMNNVYNGKITLSGLRGIPNYLLYILFFPKFISGPIESPTEFCKQLDSYEFRFDSDFALKGLCYILWGYFEKIVIADHAALFVNELFSNYTQYHGYMLIIGAILYAIQLYADFDGYTHIALGISQMLGIHLSDNFRQPYMSLSVREFWHRWHISLSTWLKNYIYIPLGGSRCSISRRYFNILMTFAISGMWHGAGIKYLVWGGLHGIYQIGEIIVDKTITNNSNQPKVKKNNIAVIILKWLITFILVDFAWIFFRANSFGDATLYIRRIISDMNLSQILEFGIYDMKFSSAVVSLMLIGIVTLIVSDIVTYRGTKPYNIWMNCSSIIRWLVCFILILVIIIGEIQIYGESSISSFIYADF